MRNDKRILQDRRKVKCKARAAYHDRLRLGLDIVECTEIRNFLTLQPMCADCPGAGVDRRSGAERRG